MIQTQTVTIPPKQFDLIHSATDEDIDISIEWIQFHLMANQTAETIQSFAHINRGMIEIILSDGIYMQHQAIRDLINETGVSGDNNNFTPFVY